MSKSFEQEYREMMNSQTPDLWDRIENGVNNSERANGIIKEDNVLSWSEVCKKVNKEDTFAKKPAVNMYQMYALLGVVACVALVMVGAPAVKQTVITEQEAQQGGEKYLGEQSANDKSGDSSSQVLEEKADTTVAGEQKKSEASDFYADDKNKSDAKEKKNEGKKAENKKQSTSSEADKPESTSVETTIDTVVTIPAEADIADKQETSLSDTEQTEKKEVAASSSNNESAKKAGTSSSEEETLIKADDKVNESKPDSSSAVAAYESVGNNTEAAKETSTTSSVKSSTTSSSIKSSADENVQKQEDAEGEGEPEESKNVQLSGAEEAAVARDGIVYNDIKAKVTAISNKDGKVIYTLKVIEDPSGIFKKGKKLKMVSEKELKKKGKYVLSFADYGDTFKKGTILYTVIDAVDFQ